MITNEYKANVIAEVIAELPSKEILKLFWNEVRESAEVQGMDLDEYVIQFYGEYGEE